MSVTLNINTMSSSLKRIQKKLAQVPKEAFKEFVSDTPIRSGNARRKTKLKGKTIVADYPYAKRLDEGYSKQSPDGMTKPTEAFIKKRVAQILKGK
tara:strand:+ start:505 stop:792 length:288 start_codon:yes stop_codon:yes gene_type:complete